MDRIIHVGNTEEHYTFRPDEILYAKTLRGTEKIEIFLLNDSSYILPCCLSAFAKIVHDSLLNTKHRPCCKIGRFYIANCKYINDVEIGTIKMLAEVEGIQKEKKLRVSDKICEKLRPTIGNNRYQMESYMHENHPENYYIKTEGGGGQGMCGFMMREYIPKEHGEGYYDIDDDDILFLGV